MSDESVNLAETPPLSGPWLEGDYLVGVRPSAGTVGRVLLAGFTTGNNGGTGNNEQLTNSELLTVRVAGSSEPSMLFTPSGDVVSVRLTVKPSEPSPALFTSEGLITDRATGEPYLIRRV